MRTTKRALVPLAVLAAALALPSAATAHPTACSDYAKESSGFFSFVAATFVGPNDDGEKKECQTRQQIAKMNDAGALQPGETARSKNVHLLANLPQTGPFADFSNDTINSDIAFWGRYAFQGNYQGFQITDISDPEDPSVVSQVNCPGSQNDISVWQNLVILSTDSRRTDDSCTSKAFTGPQGANPLQDGQEYWEGLKVFDWSNPTNPQLVSTIETKCGSHTHTLVPDGDRLVVYVSSYDVNDRAKDCDDTGSIKDHDIVSIVDMSIANPKDFTVTEKDFWPDGGHTIPAKTRPTYTLPARQTRGCHDITVFPAIDRAAGACMGEGIIFDISDPRNPEVLARVTDPKFAFWHSATFFNDGSKVLFTDELLGGNGATCNPSVDREEGADIIYDLRNGKPSKLSYFKIDRTQDNTENCVAHNGNFIPTRKSDTYVQAWYQGGTSFIDMDDARNPREVGFFDRGPFRTPAGAPAIGGSWSSYYYNGFVYSNDIQLGLDVMKFSDKRAAGAGANKLPYLNAQTQEPLRK